MAALLTVKGKKYGKKDEKLRKNLFRADGGGKKRFRKPWYNQEGRRKLKKKNEWSNERKNRQKKKMGGFQEKHDPF